VKGHVTLKTGVMMINPALITGINYTLLYNHIEKKMIYIGIIFHYFYCIFHQINAAFVSRKDWNQFKLNK